MFLLKQVVNPTLNILLNLGRCELHGYPDTLQENKETFSDGVRLGTILFEGLLKVFRLHQIYRVAPLLLFSN